MNKNAYGATAMLVVGLLVSGCGGNASKIPPLVDDIAKSIGTNSDDVMEPLAKHADQAGTSVEDLAGTLRSQADEAAANSQGEQIYTIGIELACDTLVNTIETYEETGSLTRAQALEALFGAVAARNAQWGVQDNLNGIRKAADKAARGENAELEMLVFSMTYCPVVTAG